MGKILANHMTVAEMASVFEDFNAEPAGGSKSERAANFLSDLRDSDPLYPNELLRGLSELAHPNNFAPHLSDQTVQELKECLRHDGLAVEWMDGSYQVVSATGGSANNSATLDLEPTITDDELSLSEKDSMNSTSAIRDQRKIFVVHGRDPRTHDFFAFLRAAGLEPLEWEHIVADLRKPSPYTLEVIQHGLSITQAFVVFATGDEEAQLREDLVKSNDRGAALARAQPRPNVLIELGMALGIDAERTAIVALGDVDLGTDTSGINVVNFDGSATSRNKLLQRLQSAGCKVNFVGDHWLTTGTFS